MLRCFFGDNLASELLAFTIEETVPGDWFLC